MDSPDPAENEQTPLLARPEESASPQHPLYAQRRRILLVVAICIVAVDFGGALAFAPNIAIFESAICKQMHEVPSEAVCKSAAVQSELALLTGLKDTFDQIPGVLLALPFGLAADRIGRRPVILLCLAGMALEEVTTRLIAVWADFIPLRGIWIAPTWQLLGGGSQVATSMVYAIITDVFPSEARASTYYQLAAVMLVGEILAPPAAAALMWQASPWVPSVIGLLLQVLGLLLAFCLPETMAFPWRASDETLSPVPPQDEMPSRSTTRFRWRETIKTRLNRVRSSVQFPVSINVVCVLGVFLLGSTGQQAVQLIVQYASLRFSWSISQASLFRALKGMITLIIMLLVLPRLSTTLAKRMSSSVRDYRVSYVSAWLLTLGAAVMASASHPVAFAVGITLFAAGWGHYSALLSFVAALVKPTQIATISTAVALAKSIGTLIAGPVLAAAFRRGIHSDGALIGLPYMVEAALLLAACCLLQCIRVPNSSVAFE